MKPRSLYVALCVLGTVLPYTQFVPFLRQHGLDLGLFSETIFLHLDRRILWHGRHCLLARPLGLRSRRRRRLTMKHLWAPIVASLTVGVSLGLPLFLYMREVRLARSASA